MTEFQSIFEGVYGDEEYGDVALCLICRVHGQFTNGAVVMIDVNLEDPGGLQIWRSTNYGRIMTDAGQPLPKPPDTEIVEMEQEARQQAESLLERLEKLFQQGRTKKEEDGQK